MIDVLIVGGGIAGSVLAMQLHKAGHEIILMDNPQKSSASRVAAGLINPIAGKRFEIAWKYDELLDDAFEMYSSMQTVLQTNTYVRNVSLQRLFADEKEKNTFERKYADGIYERYVEDCFDSHDERINKFIVNDYGGFYTKQSAVFEYSMFLDDVHSFLSERILYEECSNASISKIPGGWKLQLKDSAVETHTIVFCDGWHGMNNPFVQSSNVQFDVTKGEMCIIHAPEIPQTDVISKGFALIPVGKNTFRCAATFQWNEYHAVPTKFGYERLNDRIQSMICCDWTMLEHSAGIRPTVFDHKPIIGEHPKYPSMFIFSGLGTKGALYAPYFSKKIQKLLEKTKVDIEPEVHIQRWWNL